MQSQPFFSILIPTKNRAEIVGGALRSVLDQSYGDYEIILSDNDDSPTATRDAVALFNDDRIKYHRTSGKLPMHENWENALMLATGRHVIVLEDKMRLMPGALRAIEHCLHWHGDVPVSFGIKFTKHATLPEPMKQPLPSVHYSTGLVDRFCRFDQGFFDVLPRGLNSSVPRELALEMKRRSASGYAFSPMSPDYAFGFGLLSHCNYVFHFKEPLMYVPNNWMWRGMYSNGQASYTKSAEIHRFLSTCKVSAEDILQWVPVKTQWLWINGVFYDFATKYKRPEHQPRVCWVRYHSFCCLLIVIGLKMRADMREEVSALVASMRQSGIVFALKVIAHFAYRIIGLSIAIIAKRIGLK